MTNTKVDFIIKLISVFCILTRVFSTVLRPLDQLRRPQQVHPHARKSPKRPQAGGLTLAVVLIFLGAAVALYLIVKPDPHELITITPTEAVFIAATLPHTASPSASATQSATPSPTASPTFVLQATFTIPATFDLSIFPTLTPWGTPFSIPTLIPPPPQATLGEAPSAMVSLPISGECLLATREAFSVNVRQQPSTSAPIATFLSPDRAYNILSQSIQPDGSWFQTSLGWVRADIVRLGGNCNAIVVNGAAAPPVANQAPTEAPVLGQNGLSFIITTDGTVIPR